MTRDKFEVISTEAAEAMICNAEQVVEVFDGGSFMSYLIHKGNDDKALLTIPAAGSPFLYHHK